MKTRDGFVSNSSSTSFLVIGKPYVVNDVHELFEKFAKQEQMDALSREWYKREWTEIETWQRGRIFNKVTGLSIHEDDQRYIVGYKRTDYDNCCDEFPLSDVLKLFYRNNIELDESIVVLYGTNYDS